MRALRRGVAVPFPRNERGARGSLFFLYSLTGVYSLGFSWSNQKVVQKHTKREAARVVAGKKSQGRSLAPSQKPSPVARCPLPVARCLLPVARSPTPL